MTTGSLHAAIDAIYTLEACDETWPEIVQDSAGMFFNQMELRLAFFLHGAHECLDGKFSDSGLQRFDDQPHKSWRVVGNGLATLVLEAQAWEVEPRIDDYSALVHLRCGEAHFFVEVVAGSTLRAPDFNAVELFLHHMETSFVVRQFLKQVSQNGVSPRAGLTEMMRALRDDSDELGLDESALDLWNGVLDGTWTLIDLSRNGSRWHVVAKENPVYYRDPRALSPREKQVLERVAQGQTNKTIAHELELEPSTVGSYLARGLNKLRLPSRVELVGLRSALGAWKKIQDDENSTAFELQSIQSILERKKGERTDVFRRLERALESIGTE